jgi:peptide/nickel transport system substrate-binding protein
MRLLRPLLVVTFLAACNGEKKSSNAHVKTLVLSQPADADNMLPPFSTNEISAQVDAMVFERLAELDDSMHTIGDLGARPSLADSWTWAPDSLSIAFHLDPKAHWQDGVPVRAADVVYSFRVNKSPVIGSSVLPLLGEVDSVSARDSVTAVAWFHARSPEQFYNSATQLRVLPAHLLEGTPDSLLRTSKYARSPVGSGPYKFVRWVSGSSIEVDADSTYHRGRPKIDRLVWTIAANPDAALLRLLSGEANFTSSLRKQDLEQMAKHPELKVVRYPALGVFFMRFNEHARKSQSPHKIFGDRDVRRALSMAIDRRRVVTTVFDSSTLLLSGPFTSNLATYDTALPRIPYAPDSAAAILQQRGWIPGKDGIRYKGGVPLEFSVIVPGTSSQREQMAVLLQDLLKRVGARMTLEHMDFPTMLARTQAHDFDASFEGMLLDPTPSGIRQEWSTAAAKAGGTSNTGYYANPAFDATIDSATATMDTKLAVTLYRRAYGMIIADAPAVWLYESPGVAGMTTNVHPAAMRADMWWARLNEWTIDDGPAPKGASVALSASSH